MFRLNSTQLNSTQLKRRNSNFELLRIIAMFSIVLAHTPSQSYCLGYGLESNMSAKIFHDMVSGWTGSLGNCLFIMISSWFLIDSKFTIKNLFKIWFSVFSVSLVISLSLWLSKTPIVSFLDAERYLSSTYDEVKHLVTKKELILSLTPLYHNIYWFAGTYVIFYICIPFLNILIKNLTKKMHLILAIGSFSIVCLLPEMPKEGLYKPMVLGLDIFFVCYFITTYIKIYSPNFSKRKACFNIIGGCLIIVMFMSIRIIFDLFEIPKKNFIKSHLISNWSCIIAAMLLFCGFKELPEKFNAVINKFGGATFGVYLIHGQLIFYPFVLQKIFKIGERLNSGYIIPWTIFTLIVVYIVFSLVEMLRKETIERFAMKIYFIIENKVKLLYKNES